MKVIFRGICILLTVAFFAVAQQARPAAEITFSYTRIGGLGNNQFAIWVEDANGQFIKTLFATRWAARAGHARRQTSIPMWVARSNAVETSRAQIDAVSGATPKTGTITHTWDGTNCAGQAVPNGDYVIVLESSLRRVNQVYYRAPITIGQGARAARVNVERVGNASNDTPIVGNVRVRTLR